MLRDFAAVTLRRLGLTDPSRRLQGRFTIATFHRVLPEARRRAYPLPGLVVTPEELDWYVAYFRDHFRCGSLRETMEAWRRGDVSRPLLAITFDDGQLDNYEHARPVLERRGVHATFYVPVSAIERREPLWHDRVGFAARTILERAGRPSLSELIGAGAAAEQGDPVAAAIRAHKHTGTEGRAAILARLEGEAGAETVPEWAGLMSWAQIDALATEGHEIGSHSMTHALLPECTDAAVDFEIGESRRLLQQRVRDPITSFCYPNGDYDQRAIEAARKVGYECAVTTRWGSNRGFDAPFELLRCDMDSRRVRSTGGALSRSLLSLRLCGFVPATS
jgi:peptidoglycan/xylan/chitin deacetylase (PgdA/CDA1 family)